MSGNGRRSLDLRLFRFGNESQAVILVAVQTDRGFTLIELVTVLLLLGILATVAVPRFFDLGFFQERGIYDEVVAAVRHARQVAVASGCEVQVRINAGADAYGLYQREAGCAAGSFARGVEHPAGSGPYRRALSDLPAGISLAPATITFDPVGRANGAGPVTVGSRSFTVVGETGYVDAP